jgi:Trypsin-like peptidase domain
MTLPSPAEFPTDQPGVDPWMDVFPVFAVEVRPDRAEEPRIVEFVGTAFRVWDVVVTCWHCVSNPAYEYAVAVADDPGPGSRFHGLYDLAQDANGTDLATARVYDLDASSAIGLTLSPVAASATRNVWTLGYPLGTEHRERDGQQMREVDARALRGYVIRSFTYDHHEYGRTPSYELDMPTPAGLSGAPLMIDPGLRVVGVVYGENDVARIEQFSTTDPGTGDRTPEVQRIVSFGLAHYTSTLHAIRGPATNDLPLVDYLATVSG